MNLKFRSSSLLDHLQHVGYFTQDLSKYRMSTGVNYNRSDEGGVRGEGTNELSLSILQIKARLRRHLKSSLYQMCIYKILKPRDWILFWQEQQRYCTILGRGLLFDGRCETGASPCADNFGEDCEGQFLVGGFGGIDCVVDDGLQQRFELWFVFQKRGAKRVQPWNML